MVRITTGSKTLLRNLRRYQKNGGRITDLAAHIRIRPSSVYAWVRRDNIPLKHRHDVGAYINQWYKDNEKYI